MSRASHLKVIEDDCRAERLCVGCGASLAGKRRDATCCSQWCYKAARRAADLGVSVAELPDGRGRHGNHAKASAHPCWRGGVVENDRGYLLVLVGREHPLADVDGYAYLHRLVWAAAQAGAPEYDIHHDDEDKQNNRLQNLRHLTRSEHGRLHAQRRREAKGG